MKSLIIASVTALVVFSSCSVYREGQTPDDLYYSPGRSTRSAAYVEANGDRDDGRRYDDRAYNDRSTYNGYDDYATPDDRWLMMRVRNRYRWSYFDDYNYFNPYSSFGYNGWGGYGGGYGFGYQPGFSFGIGLGGYYDPYGFSYNRFNDYYNWNSYYNPYYPKVIAVNPKNDPAGYNSIRNFNLNSYNNRAYNNNRAANGVINNNRANQGYNNSNNNRTLGNSFRRMFSNGNNSTVSPRGNETYRPAQTRPIRTYTPSNNSDYNNSSSNSTYSPRSSGSSNSGGSSGSSSSGSSSGSRPNRR